jgi:hypothetical protein
VTGPAGSAHPSIPVTASPILSAGHGSASASEHVLTQSTPMSDPHERLRHPALSAREPRPTLALSWLSGREGV